MERDDQKPYESPRGLHFRRFYPVEGDSAIAEICWDDDQVGQLSLRDVRQDRQGGDRTVSARVELVLFPRDDSSEWVFSLEDFLGQLEDARTWLLQNEEGRTPIGEGPLTAAGSAFDKISASDPLWRETGP